MFPEIHVVFVMYRFLNIYISEPNHKVSNLKNELLKKLTPLQLSNIIPKSELQVFLKLEFCVYSPLLSLFTHTVF